MPTAKDQFKAFNRGQDLKSPGHLIPDGFVARAQNVRFPAGVPEKIGGFERFFAGDGRPPDDGDVLFFVQHIIGSARLQLVVTNANRMYTFDDTTNVFTQRRRLPGVLGTALWWSAAFGSTKIIGDGVNLPWRLETSGRVTPLPGRRILGFESAETWTVAGVTDNGADTTEAGSAGASRFVEGTQGQGYTWPAGATNTIFNNTNGTFDIQTGPYATAPNFTTADPGHAQVRLRIFVISGESNYTSGFIRFGDDASANYRQFAFPATLVNGENLLVLNYSASTTVGTPPTTAAVRITISITQGAGSTLVVVLDDLYIAYQNGGPVGADMGEVHKSILFQSGDSAVPFRIYFSNPNNPSYFTPTDVLDVFDKVALDPRIEIRALKSFFDTLIVGTHNTVFGVNGSNRDTFTISEQASGQGMSDHRSVAPFGDTFLYRYKSRLYAYSVSTLQAISLPIEPLMEEVDEMVPMVAIRWIKRNVLWFTYLNTSGTQQILQWDYGSGQRAWSTLTIPAVACFPYVTTAGVAEILTLNTDGLLHLQDRGAEFDGTQFEAIVETRWLGADSAPRVRKWLRAHLLAQSGLGISVQWRVSNDPAGLASAVWSTAVTLNSVSFDEGSFLDIGEYGRFFQLRVTQSESASVLVFVSSFISNNPHHKFTTGELGFIGEAFTAFGLDPPLTVTSYPLHRRT